MPEILHNVASPWHSKGELPAAFHCEEGSREGGGGGGRGRIVAGHPPKGRMPNGSSIWTPISSIDNNRKQMMTDAGTMDQWQLFHRVKGMMVSQITKNLEVCLHLTTTIQQTCWGLTQLH